ncbi:MAG: phytoene/squalene synthase family protein [Rhodospirillales bacterium]
MTGRAGVPPLDDNRHCAELVRQRDYDRYLCGLFAPEEARAGLFALLAFNGEVARTRELVSEPILGHIRLQWWRDALDGIYDGKPLRHQIVQPLAQAVARFDLPRGPFHALLEARIFDLQDEPPADLPALERYAEATSASLTQLTLHCLGATQPRSLQAGRHVGIAWGLTGLLRAIPFHASQRRLFLPLDRLEAAGLTPGDVVERRKPKALAAVVAGIAAEARRHLRQARMLRGGIPSAALPALLPATLLDGYLSRLGRYRYDVYHPKTDLPPLARQLRLAWKASIRRF